MMADQMRQSMVLADWKKDSAPEEDRFQQYITSKIEIEKKITENVDGFFPRLNVTWPHALAIQETLVASRKMKESLALREKYFPIELERYSLKAPRFDLRPDYDSLSPEQFKGEDSGYTMEMKDGVLHIFQGPKLAFTSPVSPKEFVVDYQKILETVNSGPVKTFCHERLEILQFKFDSHNLLNRKREQEASILDQADFSKVMKVDNHIHLAAAMTSKHLLSFIKDKLENHGDDLIPSKKYGDITLKELFSKLGIDPKELNVDLLDTHRGETFQRFDVFNNKYNPFGFSDLRSLFIKTENEMEGRYFAELLQQLFQRLEESTRIVQSAEYRLSVYGTSRDQWEGLAKWVCRYQLWSPRNRWLIQVPRIYNIFRKYGKIKSFQDMLDNLFIPLFEATNNPSAHPELHTFLKNVGGFDSVDDESKPDSRDAWVSPSEWTSEENPPYEYYMYYMYANIAAINQLRKEKGMNTFSFRPHCGESGSLNHLASAFLTSQSINHGIGLEKSPPLQYLYYLGNIGLSVSPLSNHQLFVRYNDNPFPKLFARGLNVTLSTDDPLQFHFTQDPLSEEYVVAARRFNMSMTDLSEIARNSVMQSSFEHQIKTEWLGPNYHKLWTEGNDINFSNIPNMRVIFRHLVYVQERTWIDICAASSQDQPEKQFLSWAEADKSVIEKGDLYAHVDVKAPFKLCLTHMDGGKAIHPLMHVHDLRFKYDSFYIPKNSKNLFQHSKERDEKDFLRHSPSSSSSSSLGKLGGKLEMLNGVFRFVRADAEGTFDSLEGVTPWGEFLEDLSSVVQCVVDLAVKELATEQLKLLDILFQVYQLLNNSREKDKMKTMRKDFFSVTKVDTHVHASSSMAIHDLLSFIHDQVKKERANPRTVYKSESGEDFTLDQLIRQRKLDPDNLTQDSLGMTAESTMNRLDRYLNLQKPFGSEELRETFLRKSNYIEGEFYGQLLRHNFESINSPLSDNRFVEYRISLHGSTPNEWRRLAHWMKKNNLYHPINRWVVQLPREYAKLKKENCVKNFGELVYNLFEAAFLVSVDPSSDPELDELMSHISGFDCVGNESDYSSGLSSQWQNKFPESYAEEGEPPYGYWLYYIWANVRSLNHLRRERGLSLFDLRPHCGTANNVEIMSAGYLLGDGIVHGLDLDKFPVLQHLFYIHQIPISMSPVAENAIYCDFNSNPFQRYFQRGLNVSLSTDNPLQLHMTHEPLTEEYSIASEMWELTNIDLCEIARNSVIQSGFPRALKEQWIGKEYYKTGAEGNDANKTNVPSIRLAFRFATLQSLREYLQSLRSSHAVDGSLSDSAKQALPAKLAVHMVNWSRACRAKRTQK